MEKWDTHYLRHIRNILALFSVALLIFVFKAGQEIILPFVIAVFIFLLFNPMLNRLDKLKVPNILSIITVLVLVVLIFVVLVYTIFQMVNTLLSRIGTYSDRVAELDAFVSIYLARLFDVEPEGYSFLASLNIDWLSLLRGYLTSFSTRFLGIMSDVMMILVYLLFLLMERRSFGPKMMAILARDKGERFSKLAMKMNRQVSKYLLLKIIISGVTGVMFYLVAVLTGLDFALVWGVLAFVFNFIPTIGSIIVTVGTIIMAIIQFMPEWGRIIYVGIMMISIEMVIGNIIDPKLQGVQLNISPIVILVSLAIWGYIWGLVGMFLAVPLTSMMQIVCANIPSLKPVAIFLSTGKFLTINKKKGEERKSRKRKTEDGESDSFDIEMPRGRNPEDVDDDFND